MLDILSLNIFSNWLPDSNGVTIMINFLDVFIVSGSAVLLVLHLYS